MLIKESYVDLPTKLGKTMRVFIYHPKVLGYPKAKFPAVVVYSEIYQVTGPVSRFAKDIAGQGYIVAAPLIYHNFEPSDPLPYDVPGTDKGNAYKIEKEVASYDEDNSLTIDYLMQLPTCTGKIGATGMCLGGHLAFRAALDPRVRAAVCFFATDIHNHALGKGKNDDSLARVGEVKGELVMIFGRKDNHVPYSGRTLIRDQLEDKGVKYTFLEINDAQHAFVRDEGSKGRYDPAITKVCFEWMYEAFDRQLRLELGPAEGDIKIPQEC